MSPTAKPDDTAKTVKTVKTVNPFASVPSSQSSENLNTANPIAIQRTASSYSEAYFDALYSDNNDPWQYQTRWYEKRKRDICLAVLPQSRYDHAIELGCGNGIFSELLAKRCQALTSIDGNKNAVQLAKQRLTKFAHVAVLQGVIPTALFALAKSYNNKSLNNESLLQGSLSDNASLNVSLDKQTVSQSANDLTYDLIVISEILYYLSAEDIDTVIVWIKRHLAVGGSLLCCHWRYAIDGFAMTGDTVHQRLQQAFDGANPTITTTNDTELVDGQLAPVAFTHQTKLAESDFLLDVWIHSSKSVAMQENLV